MSKSDEERAHEKFFEHVVIRDGSNTVNTLKRLERTLEGIKRDASRLARREGAERAFGKALKFLPEKTEVEQSGGS